MFVVVVGVVCLCAGLFECFLFFVCVDAVCGCCLRLVLIEFAVVCTCRCVCVAGGVVACCCGCLCLLLFDVMHGCLCLLFVCC